eukprot:CAMPEP_0201492214 /NCGR_PEP_ID=MMETSP0151_2-20130828/32218_1 /ASSEMBLY_ACC=CAM_ASM_000257 /TAXON_ID=200890 /ORGANISM="Paramoeba atlantica, Strain 621/1 / CCAP 1560/9" /LENGTH=320 /DNA_ID=CAMNT_0047878899 /DNA_START=8 /DNA_END=970 /DNA_ORIENTATION=-
MTEHLTHLILFSLEVGNDGSIVALDRLPSSSNLEELTEFAQKHGTKVLICFGGNGRSNSFPSMVREKKARLNFLLKLSSMIEALGLDGVDYNWEYPGFRFGQGYLPEKDVQTDYKGLARLVQDTRMVFDKLEQKLNRPLEITLAYYPDGRQEQLLSQHNVVKDANYFHSMAYDAGGDHSPFELAQKSIKQTIAAALPLDKMTLGLPFYGRNQRTGDWTTYEDLLKQKSTLNPENDVAIVNGNSVSYNGPLTIRKKTKLALQNEIGGVMIWEAGQDCRLKEVKRNGNTHVVTCPEGKHNSLLVSISSAIEEFNRENDKEDL